MSYSFLNILWVAPLMLALYFVLTYSLIAVLKYLSRKKIPAKAPLHEAEAIILNIESTGQFVDDKPEVMLQVHVQPDRGRNFISEVRAILPNINQYYSGARIWVKYSGRNVFVAD